MAKVPMVVARVSPPSPRGSTGLLEAFLKPLFWLISPHMGIEPSGGDPHIRTEARI